MRLAQGVDAHFGHYLLSFGALANLLCYLVWAYVLSALLNGFIRIFTSGSGNRRIFSAFAACFIVAFLFYLQLLSTGSIAYAEGFLSWAQYILGNACQAIWLFFLAIAIRIMSVDSHENFSFAITAAIVYTLVFTTTAFACITLKVLHCIMVITYWGVFLAITIRHIKQIQGIEQFRRIEKKTKIVRSASYLLVLAAYATTIFFNTMILGRNHAQSLEENFFAAKAPNSIKDLCSLIFTERDQQRFHLKILLNSSAQGNSSVASGIEILMNPNRYGADVALTNLLAKLVYDENGKPCSGFQCINANIETRDGEFARRVNIQGKLGDIALSPDVVEKVFDSARQRLADPKDEPICLFWVRTWDGSFRHCRLDSSVYNTIKITDNGNFHADGSYGDEDLSLYAILDFEAIADWRVIWNEMLCCYVIIDTAERIGMPNIGSKPENSKEIIESILGQGNCKCDAAGFAEAHLTKEEVDMIKRDFVRAVESKRTLSSPISEWFWAMFFRFYDARIPWSSILISIIYSWIPLLIIGAFRKSINPEKESRIDRINWYVPKLIVLILLFPFFPMLLNDLWRHLSAFKRNRRLIISNAIAKQ